MEKNICEDHCRRCYNIRRCKFKKQCPVIKCKLNCGRRFHQCKLKEHLILCVNIKRPCINSQYGCRLKLTATQMRNHLEKCPASTVICTMEWNRRPLKQTDLSCKMECSKTVFNEFSLGVTFKDQQTLFQSSENYSSFNKYVNLIVDGSKVMNGDGKENKPDLFGCSLESPSLDVKSFKKKVIELHFIYGPKAMQKDFKDSTTDTVDLEFDNKKFQSLYPQVNFNNQEHYLSTLFSLLKNERFHNKNYISEPESLNHFTRMCGTQTYPCDVLEIDWSKILSPLKENFSTENFNGILTRTNNPVFSSALVLDPTLECLSRVVTNTR